MRPVLVALLLALALPQASRAVPVTASWSLSGDVWADAGIAVRASQRGGSFGLALDDGAESRFRLFRIWTDADNPGAADRASRSLFADFALPGASARVTGSVRGQRQHGVQWASLDWGDPVEVALDGGMLSILLSDHTFGRGVAGVGRGRRTGADVFAQVRYTAGVTASPVPLPAGLPLALSAAGLLGLLKLRRRNA